MIECRFATYWDYHIWICGLREGRSECLLILRCSYRVCAVTMPFLLSVFFLQSHYNITDYIPHAVLFIPWHVFYNWKLITLFSFHLLHSSSHPSSFQLHVFLISWLHLVFQLSILDQYCKSIIIYILTSLIFLQLSSFNPSHDFFRFVL